MRRIAKARRGLDAPAWRDLDDLTRYLLLLPHGLDAPVPGLGRLTPRHYWLSPAGQAALDELLPPDARAEWRPGTLPDDLRLPFLSLYLVTTAT